MKALKLTPAVELAIDAVRRAEENYAPGGMSASVVEIPLLALARAVVDAWAAQERQTITREARLAALPRALPVGFVEVSLRHKRRRA